MAKKPVIEVGETVPRSLKFGIIVAVALLWAQFFRGILVDLLEVYFGNHSEATVDFIVALIASMIGWLILLTYPRIRSKLRRVKVET